MKRKILLMILFFIVAKGTILNAQQHDLLFALPDDNYGLIIIERSDVINNSFSLTINVKWVDLEMNETKDTNLCIILAKKDLYVNPSQYITCSTLDKLKSDFLIIQQSVKLEFDINSVYPGGEVKLEMAFKYAANKKDAARERNHQEFLFSQPEKLNLSYYVDASKLSVVILPPALAITKHYIVDPNDNGTLDAGEMNEVFFVYRNTGEGIARNVQLQISTQETHKLPTFPPVTYIGDIPPGKTDTLKVSFIAPIDISGHKLLFSAVLKEQNGFDAKSLPFLIQTRELSKPPIVEWIEPSSTFFVTNRDSVLLKLGINTPDDLSSASLTLNKISTNVLADINKFEDSDAYKYVFEKLVPLKEGMNTFSFQTRNISGTASPPELTVKHESLKGKRLALVIGNGQYEHVGELANPINDSKAMTATLKRLGFDVITRDNASQRDIILAIDEFGNRLKDKGYEVSLFYYAGHGLQFKNNNFIVPVNAVLSSETDIEYDCVAIGRVIGKMREAQASTNIIILDACRDNPFESQWEASSGAKGLAFMDAPSNTLVSYSTAPGKLALDGEGENGLFTSILLQQLVIPNQPIEQVFKNVRATVEDISKGFQTPWEVTSLRNEFYFFR